MKLYMYNRGVGHARLESERTKSELKILSSANEKSSENEREKVIPIKQIIIKTKINTKYLKKILNIKTSEINKIESKIYYKIKYVRFK